MIAFTRPVLQARVHQRRRFVDAPAQRRHDALDHALIDLSLVKASGYHCNWPARSTKISSQRLTMISVTVSSASNLRAAPSPMASLSHLFAERHAVDCSGQFGQAVEDFAHQPLGLDVQLRVAHSASDRCRRKSIVSSELVVHALAPRMARLNPRHLADWLTGPVARVSNAFALSSMS